MLGHAAAVQVPCSLQLEPMRLGTGNAVELAAGSSIPETAVTVLGGGAQRMTRGMVGGEKAAFSVVQRLWRVEATPIAGTATPLPLRAPLPIQPFCLPQGKLGSGNAVSVTCQG